MAVEASPLTFVRLKARLTVNGLRGRSTRVVLFVLGSVMAAFCAVTGYLLLAVPGLIGNNNVAVALLPLAGATLILGWLFLPLVFFGVDESLDPARFALLPLGRRTLITGLFAAALTGLPSIATLLATLGSVHSAALLGGPAAALAQLVGVIVGLFLCVALSRAVTSAFATALRSRRARDLATVLLAVTGAMLGPLQLAAIAGAENADWARVGVVGEVVGWTPLGAAYSLGPDVADGRAWTVPIKLLIVLISIVWLLRWWSVTLERAMLGSVATASRRGRAGAEPESAVDRLMVSFLPRTRFGALMSREIRYWWRETRRRASLLTLSVVGIFLPVTLAASGGGGSAMVLFVGALAAISLANQFGYEGSAYAANIVAGVPGRTEIQSRAAAFSVFIVPLLIIVATVVSLSEGHPEDIAARLGTLLAAYGIGLAVVLPVSVRAAFALPDTGNPFAMSSGGGLAKGLMTVGALAVAVIATIPLLLGAYLAEDVWRWIGLPIGLVYGAAAYAIGARLAGNLLDRRMPETLAAVSPNH